MLLEVHDLSVGYRAPVVRQAGFGLEAGQVVGLLGPNGCGKSTLLRGVCGSARIFDGRVTVAGQDALALSARQRAKYIALLPQRVGLLPGLTVGEVILMGRYAHGGLFAGPTPADRDLARHTARFFGVEDLWDRDCAALSEGQRQLVHLCRVAVQQAPVLLLDEPNSALDFGNTHRLFGALHRWVSGENRTVLAVLHDPTLALAHCDLLLLMQGGRLLGTLDPGTGPEQATRALGMLYPGIRVTRAAERLFCTLDACADRKEERD